jgi:hypothetical protein
LDTASVGLGMRDIIFTADDRRVLAH